MYSNNKQIRDVADVAARIMAGLPVIQEELKGGQVKLDKNHNGKIDGQDFKILKGEKKKIEEMTPAKEGQVAAGGGTPADKGALAAKYKKEVVKEEEQMDEEDAYDKDRYAVKNGKAVKDNPTHKGSSNYKDQPHHVYATSAENALKKHMKKEEVELDEVKMADLPSTKVQGRSYGASKPEPHAVDVLDGPKNKELAAIDAEKKKKKMSEMIAIYKEGGLKTFFESIKKEDLIIEEPDSEQFVKDLEDAKKRAAGTKPQADVAKASVQAVKQESVEQDIQVIDADLMNGIDQVDIEERHMTGGEMNKREHIVKSMKKGMAGFKERYGDRAKNVMYATANKQAMKD